MTVRSPRIAVLGVIACAAIGAAACAAVGVAGAAGISLPVAAAAACPGSQPSAPAELGPLAFGDARDYGALSRAALGKHTAIVAMAVTPRGRGYWLVSSAGRVFAFGKARSHGSARVRAGDAIVAIAATPDGRGYWLISREGEVFSFGDAVRLPGARLASAKSPIVAAAATASGRGYWLLTADGRVLARGDARAHGDPLASTGRGDFVAIAPTPGGRGYWLATASGGVLSYGDARFHGSAISLGRGARFVSIAASADGRGYWLAASDGSVLAFGDAHVYRRAAKSGPAAPVVSIAPAPGGRGYWLLPEISLASEGPPPLGKGFVACRVTAIGDSVMLDTAPALQADIPGIDVQAAVSRQWDAGILLAEQLKSEGELGASVVVDLGNNGPVSAQQFTDMMDVLAGASRVVFVTVHLPPSYSWSASVNDVLEQGVARYPRDRLADFNTLADANPQWFGADGVHMGIGGPGAQAMAGLIKAALGSPAG
jgi:hypothetical protein